MDCKYEELSRAGSVDEILDVTREYLASWSRDELERLPDSCRPAWIDSADDIESWADRLLAQSHQVALFMDDERKLDRLVSHFLIASVRMRQLAA